MKRGETPSCLLSFNLIWHVDDDAEIMVASRIADLELRVERDDKNKCVRFIYTTSTLKMIFNFVW